MRTHLDLNIINVTRQTNVVGFFTNLLLSIKNTLYEVRSKNNEYF